MAYLMLFANGVPGIRFGIDKAIIRIGRKDDFNDICLPDSFVSKAHAVIEVYRRDGGGYEYILKDLGSRNHTYVNEQMVATHTLKPFDHLRIGRQILQFGLSDNEGEMELETLSLTQPTIESRDNSSSTSGFSRRLRLLQ